MTQAFKPLSGNRAQLVQAGSAARTAFANARPEMVVRLKNRSTTAGQRIYIVFGPDTAETNPDPATAMSLDPGVVESFTLPAGASHIGTLAAAGSPELEVMPGMAGA